VLFDLVVAASNIYAGSWLEGAGAVYAENQALRWIADLAAVLADLFDFFSQVYVSRHDNMQGGAVHDPCAVLALTHPQLFTTKDHHVVVETHGELTRGMTLIDQRGLIEREHPNCTVQWDVEASKAFDVIVAAIAAFSK